MAVLSFMLRLWREAEGGAISPDGLSVSWGGFAAGFHSTERCSPLSPVCCKEVRPSRHCHRSATLRTLRTLSTSFLALAGLFLSLPAPAAESQVVTSERDTASLVTDTDRIEAGHPFKAGLLLHLKPGWHTYWKNPGDAGEPVNLTVTLSGNLSGKADAIEWPAPERLPEGPLMSYGYTGDALLPVTVTPQTADTQSQTVTISAHADWLVCAAVCVPEQGDFHLDLPMGAATPSAQAPLFRHAAEQQPRPSPFQTTITPDGLLTVRGDGLSSQAVKQAWVIPDEAGRIDQVAPQPLTVDQGQMTLRLKPEEGFNGGKSFAGLLELRDAANEKSVLSFSATPVAAAVPHAPETGWLALVAFAFLGGLILNLMPCVFPVLAMKALAILRLHEDRKHFQSGLAYTAGVLAMFGLLGAVMLVVRHAGLSAGWGFQFQSPVFVAGICWFLFAVGLGQLGLFELPVISAGQSILTRHRGLSGDFLTGLLAVLVATPCTAPFMGAAIAGALAAPPLAALGIFLAMGLGLASPYLALTLVPNAGRFLPRPGRWMDTFRQILAFPIFATCVWLIWVLAQEGGGNPVAIGCAGLLALGFSGWLMTLSRTVSSRRASPVMFAAVLIALSPAALLLLLPSSSEMSAHSLSANADTATAFSPERLASLRKDGKPVFVDMTAAWCITCLVNDHVALESSVVQKAFAQNGIVFMKGDWTNRDASITTFLHDHGRDGVPLYVYYPAHAEGRILPQVLTPDMVVQAVEGK
ncbi:cytochrome c biogenesis thiol:disulfide interchange protein DsbD [Acetobacter aceti NRIC 0242]|nr:thioredoxin family protein [Acetobacter aceti]TCS33028.1 thiol:disulfide interchange protein DsbD [Acetobacter aceti NBRC 14818]GBO81894.1 cytochrome c biogenesis thiol:disulfide interchange protein DsbD [Acetobacter aceti NRIC 0242]